MTRVDASFAGVVLSAAVPSAYILNVSRGLVGARRHRTVDVPGRAGSWIFGEEPGDRRIELAVNIEADSFAERREAVEALAGWADSRTQQALVLDDEPDRYYVAILDMDPDPEEWLCRADLSLRFRAAPYALAIAVSGETIAATGAGSDSGTFAIPDTIDAEPVVEITPTNGTITAFEFTLNGDTIGYTTPPIASGQTVTISTISDTVTQGLNGDTMLTGAFTGLVLMSSVSGVFPLLVPGTNAWALSWSGTATAVTVEISWRRRFR